ncbi:general stress protein [Arsenicicoccus sp. oral taxon 190]|uniref:general stress protein n=1 Tax=Arsenicicoccus sp. oral taxon 190 TaxID=1658671 RepID=UPI000A66D326|nr:general stress protein [Arsenicicoccus sp. oral taxon 190]
MSQTPMNPASGLTAERLQLEWPASVGVFDRYTDAQKAVDHLADHSFPVQNVMIVGTGLRQVERVTGRLSQQKVALGGLLSGMWMGLFVGLVFSIFDGQGMRTVVTTVLFGALFGLVWALIGYALTRGRRDFTSVSQVVATRYEVLVEHQLQGQAREMLRAAGLLGAQATRPAGAPTGSQSTPVGQPAPTGRQSTPAGQPAPTGQPYDRPAPGGVPTDGSHGDSAGPGPVSGPGQAGGGATRSGQDDQRR